MLAGPQPPTLAHTAAAVASLGEARRAVLVTVLLSVTVLQRFALPFAGSVVGWGLVLCSAASAWELVTGVMRFDPARIAIYAVAMSCLLIAILTNPHGYSKQSFAMLAVAYLLFNLYMPMTRTGYLQLLRMVQTVIGFVALSGLLQFGVQFLAGRDWMFPFDRIMPASFFIPNFNLRIPLDDGLTMLKSTGLWFLEPSHFSQTLGMGLVIELLYFRRLWLLGTFGLAYLVSFSGTGLVLLTCVALFGAVQTRRWEILAALFLLAIIAVLARDVQPFAYFAERTVEFANPLASGSMRLLAPYWWLNDVFFTRLDYTLFGFGPGNIEAVLARMDYAVQDSSWLKLLGEYGLVGGLPFLIFYNYVLFRYSPDRIISFACLIQFCLLGGYLNSFYIQFLHLLLVGWPRRSDRNAPASRGERRDT